MIAITDELNPFLIGFSLCLDALFFGVVGLHDQSVVLAKPT